MDLTQGQTDQHIESRNRLVHIEKSCYIRGGIKNQWQKGSAGIAGYLHEKENKIRSLPHIRSKRKFPDKDLNVQSKALKLQLNIKNLYDPRVRKDFLTHKQSQKTSYRLR